MERSRLTIAHELGHITLAHQLANVRYTAANPERVFKRRHPAEVQADAFAQRLLCPACVLHGLGLTTAEEIAKYCCVDLDVAEKRLERLKVLDKRNKYFTDPLEKELYDKYSEYIEEVRAEREKSIILQK